MGGTSTMFRRECSLCEDKLFAVWVLCNIDGYDSILKCICDSVWNEVHRITNTVLPPPLIEPEFPSQHEHMMAEIGDLVAWIEEADCTEAKHVRKPRAQKK